MVGVRTGPSHKDRIRARVRRLEEEHVASEREQARKRAEQAHVSMRRVVGRWRRAGAEPVFQAWRAWSKASRASKRRAAANDGSRRGTGGRVGP